MIDTKKRKALAEAMRQFVSGQITNDDLEDRIMSEVTDDSLPEYFYKNLESKDNAILPIVEYAWCLYDDTRNHFFETEMEWKYVRKEMARMVLFLRSSQEYKWEYVDLTNPILRLSMKEIIKSIKTFGKYYRDKKLAREELIEKMKTAGDFNYWPFLNKADYKAELKKPTLLNTN